VYYDLEYCGKKWQVKEKLEVVCVLCMCVFLCIAETDLVLPLVRNNASCLDVLNDDGVTARQLLQDFKDRVKRTHAQRHCHTEVWTLLMTVFDLYRRFCPIHVI